MKQALFIVILGCFNHVAVAQDAGPKIDSLFLKLNTESSQISLTSNRPLYMLGGKEIDYDKMSKINVSTIESITVSKNKESAALYGTSCKNGAVLIKIKKGLKPIDN